MANKKREWWKEFSHILNMWDYNKNIVFPDKTAFLKKVNWKCDKNHCWIASAYDMVKRNWMGCPVCNNKKIVCEQRNLAVCFPLLMKEWDFKKNELIDSNITSPHSGKKAWWICKNGHSWNASINGRTKGFGCPFCSGNLPTKENNLSLHNVSKDLHPTKNKDLDPEKTMPKCNKKVWWVCKNGHEYFARISDRTVKGSGCPFCHRQFSLLEIRIYSELLYIFDDTKWNYNLNGTEIDVFIPQINVGIEVDGHHWHKNYFNRDMKKNIKLNSNCIKLIRLRETPLKLLSENDISYNYKIDNLTLIKKIMLKIHEITGFDTNKYISLDKIVNQKVFEEELSKISFPKKSVSHVSPEIVKLWHPTKNGKISPQHMSFGSQKKAWWICEKGHEWEAIIATVVNGHRCPYCSGNKIEYASENSFGKKHPDLIKEWNKIRNVKLTPFNVSHKSNKKVWWTCQNGHTYLSSIASRSIGSGCLECYNNRRKRTK